jgi:hypothetical protein
MAAYLNEKSGSVMPLSLESPVLLILLGASNLSRGCYVFAKHMQTCLRPRSVEVLIACGPGRGYCVPGGLLNINYPPICSSDIFEVAQKKSESGYRVIALVTDIGNDIMYSVSAEKLTETIQQIFVTFRSMNAEVFYNTLPVAFEKTVHPAWFYILRSVLLPFSRVSYAEARAGIIAVNQFLKESPSENCHLISDMDRYLGFDEIHYGWLRAHHAWSYVAKVMLDVLGVDVAKTISLPAMIQSNWEELRRVIGADMLRLASKKPEHF